MKKSQKGFSTIEGLLLIGLVGLIVGIGWYVWQRQKDGENKNATVQEAEQDESTSRANLVKDVNIDIVRLSDFEKLPSETPKDFVGALKAKFNKENLDPEQECATIFTVEKISYINIKVSKGWVELRDGKIIKDSMVCGGGAYSIWAIKDDKWLETIAGNGDITCDRLISPKVYSEFVDRCTLLGEGNAAIEVVANPNGSITNSVQ